MGSYGVRRDDARELNLIMPSYDLLRILIKLYKSDGLDYESFTDSVNEFSSDAYELRNLVLGLNKYLESIEYHNFTDIKVLPFRKRDLFATQTLIYMEEYISHHAQAEDWNKNLDSETSFDDDDDN